jgi:hypothetical protein
VEKCSVVGFKSKDAEEKDLVVKNVMKAYCIYAKAQKSIKSAAHCIAESL